MPPTSIRSWVAGLAVNAHLWDLGPHVVIGCGNVLAEADWEIRARAEQHTAIEQHNARVLVARFFAAERLLVATVAAGHNGNRETGQD